MMEGQWKPFQYSHSRRFLPADWNKIEHKSKICKMLGPKFTARLITAVSAIFSLFPMPLLRMVGFLAGFVIFLTDRKRRRVARANLAFALGDQMAGAFKSWKICLGVFLHTGASFVEAFKLKRISKKGILKKVRITPVDKARLEKACGKGRGAVIFTAHLGGWEWISFYINALYGPPVVVGQKIKDPEVDKIVKKFRSRWGTRVLPKKGAIRGLLKGLREGRIVGMVADQSVKKNEGTEVVFFGKKTLFTPSTVLLAKRGKVPLIPVFCVRTGIGAYTLKVMEPIEIKGGEEEKEVLQQVVEATESVIRRYPCQWLWAHKRWKKTHPELYKELEGRRDTGNESMKKAA